MRSIKTKGVILKKRNFMENDHILTIYTADLGKMEIIAKGSKKITSKFTGHFELLNLNNLEIYISSKNAFLTNCQIIKSFHHDANALDSLKDLSQLAEIIDKTTGWQQPVPEIYNLILQTLKLLKKFPQKKDLLKTGFMIKVLNILGYLPDFRNCQICRKKFHKEINYIALENFHLICSDCGLKPNYLSSFKLKIFKCIHFIQTNELNKLLQLKTLEKDIDQLGGFLKQTLQIQLESELKSLHFSCR